MITARIIPINKKTNQIPDSVKDIRNLTHTGNEDFPINSK